jgi:nucleoid-associated protein YgaU
VSGYIGYRVAKRGETLSGIARQHHEDASRFNDIVRANPLTMTDPNRIFPGQELKIPIGP